MVGHKSICEKYVTDVLHIKKPKFVNERGFKCDYAIELNGKIIFFEHEASTEASNESHLHILGHLIYMVILNNKYKTISKFYWLVGPGENIDEFKARVKSWESEIKSSLKNPELFPDQEFVQFP